MVSTALESQFESPNSQLSHTLAPGLGVHYHRSETPFSLPGTLAFETIRGESGVDFIGTDGVDILFAINETGKITVDAKGGNDNVDLTNETGVIGNAEVKLGEGNDIFTVGGSSTGNNRIANSTINGGPGDDDLSPEGAINTKLRGNEGNDDWFLTGNYTATTINGNSGEDSFLMNGDITLSDSKIIGGADNDGQMDFDSFFNLLAANSVIQGGKGNDTIDIGDVSNGTDGLRITGGDGNDVINIDNTLDFATNVAYNGANGTDTFNFAASNAADAVSKGGEGNDIYNIDGAGSINSSGEAGNDTFNVTDGAGDQTMVGGLGADNFNFTLPAGDHSWVINSISESNIDGFDTFGSALGGFVGTFEIDLSSNGTGRTLVGNRLADGAEAGAGLPVAVNVTADGITNIVSAVNAGAGALTGSDATFVNVGGTDFGQINVQELAVTNTTTAVTTQYIVLNNNNNILDSGDIMFQVAAAGETADVVAAILEAY